MKKILAALLVFVAVHLGAPPPMYAGEWTLFNAVSSSVVSVPKVVQVGGDMACEIKITGTSDFVGVVTLYSGIKLDGSGDIVDADTWFTVANPRNNDKNNHLIGACPNYVSGVTTGVLAGSVTVVLRSKR